jgi:hypothetical protein
LATPTRAAAHPWTAAKSALARYVRHPGMAGDIRPSGSIEPSGLELIDGSPHSTGTTQDHTNAGCGERAVRIGAAIARQNHLPSPRHHELSGLNAGPMAKHGIRVLDGFELHRFRFDYEEVRTPTEPGVNVRIERWPAGRDHYLHPSSPFFEKHLLSQSRRSS